MAESNQVSDEMRVHMRELLGRVGFTPIQITTVMSGLDVVEGFSFDLGELSDDEQEQLSLFTSPMMAMILLEMDYDSPNFEATYGLYGDLLGEIIRATYQVGKMKGSGNGATDGA